LSSDVVELVLATEILRAQMPPAQSIRSDPTRRVLAVVRHPVGGVRTHIVYTYPTLMQAGYRFTFVIPEGEAVAPFRADVKPWDDVETVNVPHGGNGRGKPQFRATVRRLLRERRFSLIHSHGIQAAIPTIFANVGIGLPHVMTSQDVFCHVELPGITGRLKLYALQQILRRLDVLVAVSEDTRDDHLRYLPRLKKGPCRVAVIPNGIDLARYPLRNGQPPQELRGQLGIGQDTFLLGFLGRFMEQKGFLHLIEALDQLLASGAAARPVHLLAVGSGDCLVNYQWELDRYPRVHRAITFLEHVPSVAPILRELDLLVMPSLWEACSILPMEAMCMGVPVLGTNCVGLREVLRDSPSVIVPTNDPPALAAALRRAIDSPWKDKAVQYIPAARQRFDVRPVGETLAGLYRSLENGKEPC
jgi:glycosyltransferase involved in cell wall biosynthesis